MTDEEFEKLWHSLVDRYYGKVEPPLTRDEELLFALNQLAGSVPRSGMIGYFDNSTGNEILNAKEALRLCKLDSLLDILERAQSIIVGITPVTRTDKPLDLIPDAITEEDYEQLSSEREKLISPVEEEFFNHEDALCEAIDQFIGYI